jgi:hypothetical protein
VARSSGYDHSTTSLCGIGIAVGGKIDLGKRRTLMTNFEKLLANVASRPGMYLPDRRFNTLVAFVEGCDLGAEGQLLDGFSNWLQERTFGYVTNYHWDTIVAAIVLGEPPHERWRSSVDENFDPRASEELLNQLRLFLETKNRGDAGS